MDSQIATLASIFEEADCQELEAGLLKNNSDLEATIDYLLKRKTHQTSPESENKKIRKTASLSSWLSNPASSSTSTSDRATSSTKRTNNLRPLFLSTPQQVSQHLPCCSLIYDILPKDLAWNLYDNMIKDCNGTTPGSNSKPWIRNRWWLANREVQSPHSTAFFISKPTSTTDKSLENDYNETAQYWFAGKPLESDSKPRYFLEEMNQAKEIIETVVNQLLINHPDTLLRAQRSSVPILRYGQEWNGPWRANVAASNCYKGSKENVGWHSDQLTYLGPYPTIGSLSLGTTREFRLRAVSNVLQPTTDQASIRTYSISLPHNSILVMHGGCQERYKHCIATQPSIDVFKNPFDSKDNRTERINITFRFYRPDFSPSRSLSTSQDNHSSSSTPKCKCGIPAVLRADQKGKVAAASSSSSSAVNSSPQFQFFWHCQAGQQNMGQNCNFFKVLDFRNEGRGPCISDQLS
ncbi:hypothetical protein MJO29_009939 [Puccinia striiformis f. sp. tritici]|uniref:Fe2OG dioxygenase domain-containing protein n=1 Tax=Puccinia striiformis f. sp. tritici PST-78 TaxID=1165861 RepID=A0A0L0VT46_9BASI|nr:hypothetical protein Pst134EA_019007 [Puccinia striiformis f. sp. tritici]KAI9615552.1 hypothetical protein H4Q26_011493 [Puccinia striiformis f. sp. tritici PST-130]KNF02449.1 hypothetical protein PSTG_04355 [Puccinia striiformis f. sp. tritici PST-78]KAH9449076.1 hypothetical protein Pst134EB_019911 [Puccinia striiformis f. sp. tritici]KAH9458853.1 hypothetical protein Pst134EA_019007 [Puccinia striiformis f. sp. tritici]KAI7948274.1 hypothetical protein MJO29_009939 [Puccinia striiformis